MYDINIAFNGVNFTLIHFFEARNGFPNLKNGMYHVLHKYIE